MSPDHIPDIIIYIDAITIVFEEASKDGLPSSLPIACIEAGNEHSIPNLAIRLSSTQKIFYSFNFSCFSYFPGCCASAVPKKWWVAYLKGESELSIFCVANS